MLVYFMFIFLGFKYLNNTLKNKEFFFFFFFFFSLFYLKNYDLN